MTNSNKIFPCIWFNQNAKDALAFYQNTFEATVLSENPVVTEIEILGQKVMLLNA